MSGTCGRIECLITVPAGNWQVAVNDGLAYTATLNAAVTYSGPTALIAALVAALNAAAIAAGSARTWSGSIANGEQGTGYATLTCSAGANVTVTWTSTAVRDILGWTGNLSGAITFTTSYGALGLWLPDSPITQPFPLGDTGDVEADIVSIVSKSGVTRTTQTGTRTRHPGITWTHVSLARARQSQEASGVRSWERFVRTCLICSAGQAGFVVGSDVTLWWDAGAGTSQAYNTVAPTRVGDVMQPVTDDGWLGLWRCTWPGGYV